MPETLLGNGFMGSVCFFRRSGRAMASTGAYCVNGDGQGVVFVIVRAPLVDDMRLAGTCVTVFCCDFVW